MVEPKDPSLGASGPEGDARVGRPLLIAARFRRKAKGLLFSPEHAGALLLAPCNDVHTAGMRHRLDIAFVAAQGLVLEAHRDVEPCRRLRNKSAAYVNIYGAIISDAAYYFVACLINLVYIKKVNKYGETVRRNNRR